MTLCASKPNLTALEAKEELAALCRPKRRLPRFPARGEGHASLGFGDFVGMVG